MRFEIEDTDDNNIMDFESYLSKIKWQKNTKKDEQIKRYQIREIAHNLTSGVNERTTWSMLVY